MPGSSNTSFIPKRNPAQKEQRGAKRQVFVGTFIIRILFFAALLSAAGVFIYEMQLKKALEAEILALDGAIQTFNEAEMQRVLSTNARLKQAERRFNSTASLSAILRAVERSTVGSVQVSRLAFDRIDSGTYEVQADMKTKTFDSVMFQRSIFEDSDTLVVTEITDLVLTTVPPDSALYNLEPTSGELEEGVSFKAVLSVATEDVPHTLPNNRPAALPAVSSIVPVVSTTTISEVQAANTDTI